MATRQQIDGSNYPSRRECQKCCVFRFREFEEIDHPRQVCRQELSKSFLLLYSCHPQSLRVWERRFGRGIAAARLRVYERSCGSRCSGFVRPGSVRTSANTAGSSSACTLFGVKLRHVGNWGKRGAINRLELRAKTLDRV